jgi:DNA sulfur modification protein DndB
MTFEQVSDYVTVSISELFTATCLDELLQRALTKNVESIRKYLLREQERFFNAIILAIFDGDPQWLEVEFRGEEQDYTNVGFLEFTGEETIFPVDGQHRVAGIIEAVGLNPDLKNDHVPVIFIAHDNSEKGRKKTRKLFSTLNRRAKPVGQNENIALDEDDVCSIVTRDLVQNVPLFKGKNVTNSLGKQIPRTNETAFTSLITLYQCVESIVKWHLAKENITGSKYKEFMLYRPSEEVVEAIRSIVFSVIQAFISCTSVINMYLSDNSDRKAANYRNSFGGNLLFRPVAITEYFNAAIALIDYGKTYEDAFLMLNGLQLNLSENPWKGFLWDGSKMIGRVSKSTIKDLLIHMADKNVLSSQEYKTMRQVYCRSLNISETDADMVLNVL